MAVVDPLALQVVTRFMRRVGDADPALRLRHVERLTRGLMKRIEDDPHHLSVVDLVAALAEIANEAKTRR